MAISRRQFCGRLAGTSALIESALLGAPAVSGMPPAPRQAAAAEPGSHIGNLYGFVQRQASRSPLELSYLNFEFKNLPDWQQQARKKVFEHLFYSPAPVAPDARIIRQADRGDYHEEYLTFQTTPDLRVPAYVLIPKNAKLPAPGIVALHDHGGFYLWGKEKLVETPDEHPAVSKFKQQLYEGKSIAAELARQGYVVIVIDMFYWGERRMILDDDPMPFRERPKTITNEEIAAFNRRSSQSEQLVARSLMAAGITWPGIILWDDIRTLDYLASRPEVDKNRLACVGLSVGGYRSFLLAALDERIKSAVDVGWMTSFGTQLKRHVINSIGFTFHIIGLYRYLDMPDLAGLIAPRSVLVINGSKDGLFAPDGVKAAFEKIGRCFAKAQASERQKCSMYEAPHEFNLKMQEEAWAWLKRWV